MEANKHIACPIIYLIEVENNTSNLYVNAIQFHFTWSSRKPTFIVREEQVKYVKNIQLYAFNFWRTYTFLLTALWRRCLDATIL